jgi:hypothetical protein
VMRCQSLQLVEHPGIEDDHAVEGIHYGSTNEIKSGRTGIRYPVLELLHV